MDTVLVTGAGGYIGTVLVPALLAAGYRVRALDRFFFGRHLPVGAPGLQVVQEDVRHIGPAHLDGIDAVVDLAGLSNDPSGERFREATRQINHEARVRLARMARDARCRRYVLPSSCSVYGFQAEGVVADEASPTNPLTTYARANEAAERDILPLASDDFTVAVLRQATVYGYAPRMRFDLAVNGMAYGAWRNGRLPVMRDGTQWRPLVHVRDAAAAQMFMLSAPAEKVNGRVFNVGSDRDSYRIADLADAVAAQVPRDVEIEWYGDPDRRSYRVAFGRIEALGWTARHDVAEGVGELVAMLEAGRVDRTPETITLDWYETLVHWHEVVRGLEMHGGMIDL